MQRGPIHTGVLSPCSLLSFRDAVKIDSLLSLAQLTEINMGAVCCVVKREIWDTGMD